MKFLKIISISMILALGSLSFFLYKNNNELKSQLNRFNPPVTNTGGIESSVIKESKEVPKISQEMPFVFPIAKEDYITITSPYGYRISPFLTIGQQHGGLDILAVSKAQVIAAADGYIEQEWPPPNGYFRGHPTYGGLLIINHGNGFRTLYAHLSAIYVAGYQKVKAGEIIGRIGNTGASKGEHLHFEVISDATALNDIVEDAIRYNPLLYTNIPN